MPQNNLSTARQYLAGFGSQTSAVAAGGYTTTDVATTEEYNGTGYSYVNFSTSFQNSQYSVVSTGQEDSGGGARICNPKSPESSRCQFETRNSGNSTRDFIDIHMMACGDHY